MSSRSKIRVLIIGEAVAPTGFARVIRSIFTPLAERYDLHQLATRCQADAGGYPWPLYPAVAGGDVYGYKRLPELVRELQPDIVFILYDLVFQAKYMALLRGLSGPLVVNYSPVESGPIAPELMEQIAGVSRYVAFTDYGRGEIEDSLRQLRARGREADFPAVQVIPHGVDTKAFYPLDRKEARAALGFEEALQNDDFIALNANRNMPRKRIDLTMQGFAQFARGKPESVKLYLHMATEDTGWNVILLARRYGIEDRLIMTRADNVNPALADEKLNLIYNACDVGITTTTGEGWGMVAFEHAATGAAQIMPRHTALAQLWAGCAEFVEPYTKLTYPGNLTEGHIVSVEGVAAALERIYSNEKHRAALADAAFRNAARPEYQWQRIAQAWDELFRDLAMRSGD
jgi:glycosyltransferase involved in cell wall biosynthesis